MAMIAVCRGVYTMRYGIFVILCILFAVALPLNDTGSHLIQKTRPCIFAYRVVEACPALCVSASPREIKPPR